MDGPRPRPLELSDSVQRPKEDAQVTHGRKDEGREGREILLWQRIAKRKVVGVGWSFLV